MNLSSLFNAPFPRPERSRKNLFWILLLGVSCSIFVILFKPFGIQNVNDQWYYNLVIISMGGVFILSYLFMEWLVPAIIPKAFQGWTLARALPWYVLVGLFIAGMMFLYKSFWAGYRDFTWLEYVFVIGRVFFITLTVGFFLLGVYQYIDRKRLSALTAQETYTLTANNGKILRINPKDILYISSNDNYVDIHYLCEGVRKKKLFRSSLKNIETQIAQLTSPIHRCHRRHLINTAYFRLQKITSRKMLASLDTYDDQLPVSRQYADQLEQLLTVHP